MTVENLYHTKLRNRNSYGLSNNNFFIVDRDILKIKNDGFGYPQEFYNRFTRKFDNLLEDQKQWFNPYIYQSFSNPTAREHYEKHNGTIPVQVFMSWCGR